VPLQPAVGSFFLSPICFFCLFTQKGPATLRFFKKHFATAPFILN